MHERVAKIIIDELKIEGITPSEFDPQLNLIDELGIDSMDLATIVVFIQDEFGIRFDEDDYAKLLTLNDIVNYIQIKLEKKTTLESEVTQEMNF